MRVKNLNGATKIECSSGSWLAHWEKFAGQTAYRCFVRECTNKLSVGGRVQRDSATDKSWYVVPLCEECNKKTGQDLDIWDMARLVSVNAGEDREKRYERHPEGSRVMGLGST